MQTRQISSPPRVSSVRRPQHGQPYKEPSACRGLMVFVEDGDAKTVLFIFIKARHGLLLAALIRKISMAVETNRRLSLKGSG